MESVKKSRSVVKRQTRLIVFIEILTRKNHFSKMCLGLLCEALPFYFCRSFIFHSIFYIAYRKLFAVFREAVLTLTINYYENYAPPSVFLTRKSQQRNERFHSFQISCLVQRKTR